MLTGLALVVPLLALIQLLPLPVADATRVAANTALRAQLPGWLLALKALVLFPLVEECVYRGIILQLLRRYLPLGIALVPPTLLFGLTHLGFSPQNALFALLVGLYFVWLAVGSRSLLTSILCHSGINFLAVFGLRWLPGSIAPGGSGGFFQPAVIALLALSLVVLAIGVRRLRGEFARNVPAAA